MTVEPTIADDGTVLVPLHVTGMARLVMELHGTGSGDLAFVDDVARVVALRAGYLAVAAPHDPLLPALRGSEEVNRAVGGSPRRCSRSWSTTGWPCSR